MKNSDKAIRIARNLYQITQEYTSVDPALRKEYSTYIQEAYTCERCCYSFRWGELKYPFNYITYEGRNAYIHTTSLSVTSGDLLTPKHFPVNFSHLKDIASAIPSHVKNITFESTLLAAFDYLEKENFQISSMPCLNQEKDTITFILFLENIEIKIKVCWI